MKKILLVDDDAELVGIVKHILTSKGYDVYIPPKHLEVPDVVHFYNPHLILMDIRLYRKSGIEICKALKKKYNNIPLVLFSTDSRLTNVIKERHADGFVAKPFDIDDLIKTINQHLDSQAGT